MTATAERWWEASIDDWRALAACRGMAPADGTVEANPFFPADGRVPEEIEQLCEACPVRGHCATEGEGQGGIWGGVANDYRGKKVRRGAPTALRIERRRRVHRLVAMGWRSPDNIAAATQVDVRTVHRYKAESCGGDGCWCGERTEAQG